MNPAANPLTFQSSNEIVPLRHAHGIDVIDMLPKIGFSRRKHFLEFTKSLRVGGRVTAAQIIAAREVPKLNAKDGGLDAVHPAVPPDHAVVVLP